MFFNLERSFGLEIRPFSPPRAAKIGKSRPVFQRFLNEFGQNTGKIDEKWPKTG
jgi:hypothetical protein